MTTTDSIRDALLASPKARPVGARTKPALCDAPAGTAFLDLSGHRGITDYEPGEFTFTARAGTPLRDIAETLARNGQYLPFDPPLVAEGATVGGTIAAGLNGPGRLRYGGVRDFIIGATFLTGDARLIRGGGKVVKSAAGFDFPKLLVGSCGRLGVILEATFKVFPLPQERLTAAAETGSLRAALELTARLVLQPADLDALDFEPGGRVLVRLAGDHGTLEARRERLSRETGAAFAAVGESCWAAPSGDAALSVKVPLTPARVPELDAALASLGLPRRYSVAGQVAWVGLPAGQPAALDAALRACRLGGLSLQTAPARLGLWPSSEGEQWVRRAFDPGGRLA